MIADVVAAQRRFFDAGTTRPLEFRMNALRRLRTSVLERQEDIAAALRSDLGRHPAETYLAETGVVLEEIGFQLRHLPRWVRPRRVPTPLVHLPATSKVLSEPHGVTLVMAPWNYPVQLSLVPLAGALAAGNTVVLKPSAYAPASSAVVAAIVADSFQPGYVAVVEGGRAENQALLEQRFDHIFFTGSTAVGREVMAAAAPTLTPVTLELGGKSPTIVAADADLALSARRIAFGKLLNAGQTCVAPDYVLVDESVKDSFVETYRTALAEFLPGGDSSELPCLVNDKHFARVSGLLRGQRVVLGGGTDAARRFIEPTVVLDPDPDSPLMTEEIFGPVLPVIGYRHLDEAIAFVTGRPKPLALYLFSTDRAVQDEVLRRCSFGGGCLNDTIVHLANPHLGFGGVGDSGMGSYHGRHSFDTFSHHRSVLARATWLDLPIRYHPYTPARSWIVRKLLG